VADNRPELESNNWGISSSGGKFCQLAEVRPGSASTTIPEPLHRHDRRPFRPKPLAYEVIFVFGRFPPRNAGRVFDALHFTWNFGLSQRRTNIISATDLMVFGYQAILPLMKLV
jgi:hypothetical protein